MNKNVIGMMAMATLVMGLVAGSARAQTAHYEQLECWEASATGGSWAAPTALVTTTGAGTETRSVGFNFDASTDEEIQCYIQLPGTYDSGGVTPAVVINGWFTQNGSCSGDPAAKFDVTSRAYAAGETLNAAWIGSGTAYATEPCVLTTYPDDKLFQVSINSTTSAAAWNPDELVFFRIVRDADHVGDTFPYDFHVSRVRLSFETDP